MKNEVPTPEEVETKKVEVEMKMEVAEEGVTADVKDEKIETEQATPVVTPKRKSPRKKPRKDLFEELDVS